MVTTGLEANMTAWLASMLLAVKSVRGRTLKQGADLYLHAMAVRGQDSHGQFYKHETATP